MKDEHKTPQEILDMIRTRTEGSESESESAKKILSMIRARKEKADLEQENMELKAHLVCATLSGYENGKNDMYNHYVNMIKLCERIYSHYENNSGQDLDEVFYELLELLVDTGELKNEISIRQDYLRFLKERENPELNFELWYKAGMPRK